MSPSGRLCLLTIVGLILPIRGQTWGKATSISPEEPDSKNIQLMTPAPDAVYPEPQPTPQIPTRPANEATQNQTETPTQQATETDGLLKTDPGIHESGKKVTLSAHPMEGNTMLSERRPQGTDARTKPQPLRPSGSREDNPFFYDEHTLRKRGLLVAAVLFITGILILTSGKCRQLSQLCRNRCRTYRIVSIRSPA
ncbi:FXYD domain-containing ion transport regulator 5 isoform X2 [Carlito syrichta]|uniref:FXYD domain-containing ion transport regulator n=2 Tax=Carlito syrichta TaxID=1868482 RepID=A0A1U7UDH4_CARSF|nr:FXYD domain-containing ion transport regulator 5 isoform X2 [Carlito syrichta]